MVNIADLERCAVAVQTARPQCRQSSLVGQFCQRIGLIHKLGQLGRAEKFLHRRGHRADIDQVCRRSHIHVLYGHSFANHSFETAHTHAQLVLQQLAHRTQAAVAQMVNVVGYADAVTQVHKVADKGIHVVNDDVTGNQLVEAAL